MLNRFPSGGVKNLIPFGACLVALTFQPNSSVNSFISSSLVHFKVFALTVSKGVSLDTVQICIAASGP